MEEVVVFYKFTKKVVSIIFILTLLQNMAGKAFGGDYCSTDGMFCYPNPGSRCCDGLACDEDKTLCYTLPPGVSDWCADVGHHCSLLAKTCCGGHKCSSVIRGICK
ncbi:uncharacterized protein [Spinacia oleracea]|uniref:Granulins domain-containing protein n=1 Tax=Spinacia oleracea TaxID=3562 RepID=A0ABM3R5I5_SPIOL|nr:uncharacterized protein LOC130466197 [Spinacia oleracea]